MSYHILSGDLVEGKQVLSIDNRAFRYADALFESMYYTRGEIQYLDKHWLRLHQSMQQLRMKPHLSLSPLQIHNQVEKLVKVNEIKAAARVRLQVFRKSGGFYAPESREVDYLLEVSPLENTSYQLNKKGLHIGIATGVKKEPGAFSQVKTTSKIEMVLCAMEAQDRNWDDAVLLNKQGNLVETSHSNLFLLKNGAIYTPKLENGPLNGIMRQNIIELCLRLGIKCKEENLNSKDLMEADEVFLTNAVRGIRWVSAFKSKRYFNNTAKKLTTELNRKL